MKIILAVVVLAFTVILVQTSMDHFSMSNKQTIRQKKAFESSQSALVLAQILRSAYDLRQAGPCPVTAPQITIDSVPLCWPSGSRCFVPNGTPIRYCLATDQSPAHPPASSGGLPGGGNIPGAVPVTVRAPNCSTATSSCLDCINSIPGVTVTCISAVFCIGTTANAACTSGTKVIQSFGFRN